MSASSALFVCGAITFLVVFSWFKVAAIEIFKSELLTNSTLNPRFLEEVV